MLLYFFNLPFYPLSENGIIFAAQILKNSKIDLYKNMIWEAKDFCYILWYGQE